MHLTVITFATHAHALTFMPFFYICTERDRRTGTVLLTVVWTGLGPLHWTFCPSLALCLVWHAWHLTACHITPFPQPLARPAPTPTIPLPFLGWDSSCAPSSMPVLLLTPLPCPLCATWLCCHPLCLPTPVPTPMTPKPSYHPTCPTPLFVPCAFPCICVHCQPCGAEPPLLFFQPYPLSPPDPNYYDH